MTLAETALVLVLGLLAYLPAIRGPLVWDDYNSINETALSGVLWRGLWLRLTTRASWRAVFELAKKLNAPELHLPLQHTTSLLLHIGVALATGPLAAATGADPLLVALTVALHPLATSAVAQIGQRASVLSWFLTLMGLNCVVWFGIFGTPLAAIFWAAALMAKEDFAGPVGLLGFLTRFKVYATTEADRALAASGAQIRLSRSEHLPRALAGSLSKLLLWFFGLSQSVEHRSPAKSWSRALILLCTYVAASAVLVRAPGLWPIAALLWLSPMVLYWFVPTAHILFESRFYSIVTVFGLVVGLLPLWAALPLVLLWGCQTAWRCYIHADAIRFWESALQRGTKLTVWTNLAAQLQARQQLELAEYWNTKLVEHYPNYGLAYVNQGLIEMKRAVDQYVAACQELEQLGRRGAEHQKFQTFLQRSVLLLRRGAQLNPNDKLTQQHYSEAVAVAKALRVKVLV